MATSGIANCTHDKPINIITYFSEITTTQAVLLSISGVLLAGILILYITECVLTIRKHVVQDYIRHILYIQGTYVAYSVMSFLALISPTSSLLVEFVFAIYFSFTLVEFLSLKLIIIENNKNNTTPANNTVSLAGPPLACCFCCLCPHVKANNKFVKFVKAGVYQAVVLRPCFTFIQAFLLVNGFYGTSTHKNSTTVLEILNAVCVLVAMYWLNLLYRAKSDALEPFYIKTKFVCIQLVMLIVCLQQNILRLLAVKGAIPCKDPFNSVTRASDIHHMLVLPEMLLLLAISSSLCCKKHVVLSGETEPLINGSATNHTEA